MENENSRREFLRRSLVLAGGIALPREASAAVRAPRESVHDVVIYGGSCAAVTAAVQTARMGKTVAIVCPEHHLGGLTTSGLGWTDSKNGKAIGGLAREFYHRVWQYYSQPEKWSRQTRASYLEQNIQAQPGLAMDDAHQVMWTFEPHAAEQVMEEWLAAEKVAVFRGEWLDREKGVVKRGNQIAALVMKSGKRFKAKMFIDASYEGDLMAASGVQYRVGRDSAQEWDEPLNGIRFMQKGLDTSYADDEYHGVDPFVTPGSPQSGLIAGIEGVFTDMASLGHADPKRLQSFNYRLCLTTNPQNQVPFSKPAGYDDHLYELLFRLLANGAASGFTTQAMPNKKIDANSHGPMGGDFIGGSFSAAEGWTYSELDYEHRRQVIAAHRDYQEGLLWTLQHHERVPVKSRQSLAWGLSKDEFADNGNWPYQLYVREARRMIGCQTVTQHHVQQKPGYEVSDSIGMGSYSLDSHTVRRVLVDGKIRNEGSFYVWEDKAYPLPLGSLLPKKHEVANLIVPVTLSATHAAFGSIRMEPTYMILGQSAATIAVLALQRGIAAQDVSYSDLAKQLTADKQVLAMPPLHPV